MSFDFYFFVFRLSNVLSVNTYPLFKLSSSLSNILLITTDADNHTKDESFAVEIDFQIIGWCQYLNLKSPPSII